MTLSSMGGFFMAEELFNATEDNFLLIGAAILMYCVLTTRLRKPSNAYLASPLLNFKVIPLVRNEKKPVIE